MKMRKSVQTQVFLAATVLASLAKADTIAVDTDTTLEAIPSGISEITYEGAGKLTITGANPINLSGAVTVVFNCETDFTAEDATITLRSGSVAFAKPVSFKTLHLLTPKTTISGSATVSGTKLDVVGLDSLNSGVNTTVLHVDNSTEEVANRFSGLAELRAKGPAQVKFTGASSTEANSVDRLAKFTLGPWKTQIVLADNMTLTLGTTTAEPGGLLLRSVATGSYLKSEEGNVNGIWKPFTDIGSGGAFSSVDAEGNVGNLGSLTALTASGLSATKYYSLNSAGITLSEDGAIGGLRFTGWGDIDLNGHDLTVASGVIGSSCEFKNLKIYDNAGGGRLVIGGQDFFVNFQNNYPVISAPLAWNRPAGNTSAGPSLYVLGNHWSDIYFSGDDQIGDYNIVYVGDDTSKKVSFGGAGDRRIHGAIVGTSPVEKTGTGTLRIMGPRYPGNSGTMTIQNGRVILDKAESRYYTMNVNGGATLELASTFNGAISSLTLNNGATLAGSGTLTPSSRDFNDNVWLAPGATNETGTLNLSASGNDARYYFYSGCGFKIKLGTAASDCVNINGPWNYVSMPSSGTVDLDLAALDAETDIFRTTEYVFLKQSNTVSDNSRFSNASAFTWNITTSTPNLLDISNATVTFRNRAYHLTGVRRLIRGFVIVIR